MRKVLAILLMVFLLAGITACGKTGGSTTTTPAAAGTNATQGGPSAAETTKSAETTLDRVLKNKKLVLGTSADYAPYEFHKLIDGKDTIVGFDIDIAKEIAKDLGVDLVIEDMDFDGLLQALNTDKVDIVIAGMTPNEERKQSVDFSNIYYYAKQGVMVRTEDKDKYTTIDSLKGKKVGVQLGTIQEEIANSDMPESNIVSLTKIPDLVMELKNKKVEAIIVELPVANGYVQNNPDLAISDISVEEDTGGSAIAVKKNNPELIEAINKTLDRIIKDGTLDKFVLEANELNETQ